MKKILAFIGLAVAAVIIWFAFGLWTGIYSIYSIPPSKEHPDGATLIISRDEREPMFNSADTKPPGTKFEPRTKGLAFEGMSKPRRPIESRTIVTLPYVKWAYEKSLEPQKP